MGTNGMVSLRHSVGMSHFTADVVGYYLAVDGVAPGRSTARSPTRVSVRPAA